jgi:hypothetical protein
MEVSPTVHVDRGSRQAGRVANIVVNGHVSRITSPPQEFTPQSGLTDVKRYKTVAPFYDTFQNTMDKVVRMVGLKSTFGAERVWSCVKWRASV